MSMIDKIQMVNSIIVDFLSYNFYIYK